MKTSTRKLTLSALFLALGLVLPLITGQIPQIGKMLLPMHIPVLLCGMVCGWPYGLAVGAVMPLLRGLLFGMPVLYPTGIGMAFELAAYGAVIGLLYAKLNKRGVAGVGARHAGRARCVGRGPNRAAGPWRQWLYHADVHCRCICHRAAGHCVAAGADPRGDGGAGTRRCAARYGVNERKIQNV
jgi:hypothetical protein